MMSAISGKTADFSAQSHRRDGNKGRQLPFSCTNIIGSTLRESKLLPPLTCGQPSAGRGPRYQRRAIDDSLFRRARERTIRTRPSTVSPRNFVFTLSFLTSGPDISQRPSTEGPSPEGIIDGSALIPRESKLLPPLTRGLPSAGRRPIFQRRAIGGTVTKRAYDGKAAKNVSAESVRWEGSEERISGERTMGRQ
jgi:hypothetical protein